jgi:hypothetical protein
MNNLPIFPDAAAIAEAKNNPNGWVYKIDFQYAPNDYVPPEAIQGAWKVNSSGVIEGDFEVSPNYREIEQSKRILPSFMQVNRLHNAGMWISEIDPRFENYFPNIPPEAIVGYWLIDSNGNVTDQFRPSSKYAPNRIDAMLKDLVKKS